MPTLIPDRLSLRTIRQDYWRSLRKYNDGKRDLYTIFIIFVAPLAAGGVAIYPLRLVITNPEALLAAVSLLAGVLLAAAGQVVTLRARIADSLVLAANERVTGLLRETMSGVLLAAVAALVDALLLGALSVVLTDNHRWWHIALSGAILAVTIFIALMFVVTARRMYTTYLEAFEDGAPLPKTKAQRHG